MPSSTGTNLSASPVALLDLTYQYLADDIVDHGGSSGQRSRIWDRQANHLGHSGVNNLTGINGP